MRLDEGAQACSPDRLGEARAFVGSHACDVAGRTVRVQGGEGRGERRYDQGVTPDRQPVLALAVWVAIVVGAAFLRVPSTPEADPARVEEQLLAELGGRVGTIARWRVEQAAVLEHLVDDERIRDAAHAAARGAEVPLADRLARSCVAFEGCAVYALDGRNLADFRAREAPAELGAEAARGRTVQSRLRLTDEVGRLDPEDGSAHFGVHFATPIVVEREVEAVLVARARPDRELDPLLTAHRPGRTGETYVVDPRGYMVTRSRFEVKPPRPRGVAPLVLDRPAIAVRTGPDRPTRAARAARDHLAGVDVHGYLDYRGVRVVGAWRWLEDLDVGVITEMDATEAYHR